jgi:hypothetical protein
MVSNSSCSGSRRFNLMIVEVRSLRWAIWKYFNFNIILHLKTNLFLWVSRTTVKFCIKSLPPPLCNYDNLVKYVILYAGLGFNSPQKRGWYYSLQKCIQALCSQSYFQPRVLFLLIKWQMCETDNSRPLVWRFKMWISINHLLVHLSFFVGDLWNLL